MAGMDWEDFAWAGGTTVVIDFSVNLYLILDWKFRCFGGSDLNLLGL